MFRVGEGGGRVYVEGGEREEGECTLRVERARRESVS